MVRVLPLNSGCNRNYVGLDQHAAVSQLFAELLQEPWTIYAVAKTAGSWREVDGVQFVAIFQSKANPDSDLQLGITGTGVRIIARGCGGTPPTDAASFTEFIIRPPS
jgi:hypothetical protein